MKKRFWVITLLFSLLLAACGGSEVVDQARATAEGVAQGVSDTAEEAINTVTGSGSETAALCNVDDIPQATQADVTIRFVNNTDGQVAIIWRDVEQSPPALTEYTVLATGESYDQETFVGHEWIAEDQAGNGIVEYTATSDAAQCLVIESDDLVMMPVAETAGETFAVDPAQPIEVTDSSGTQLSVGANELVDENGNPATGDVTVNVYNPDTAADGDEANAASCEEPDTNEVLTVWSYDPETGLWVEEGLAAYNSETGSYEPTDSATAADTSCDASVATVTAEVTDDAGNEYELADGATAEVSAPCEPNPDEVLTVWSYDPETGLWVEEGPATVQGQSCTAEVSNLSNVNFVSTAAKPVSGMQGQVVDLDSGEALTGAQVCVQGTEQCATVDDNGSYSLSDLDAAELVFEVSAADYITAVQTITLASGETLAQDFALTATNPVLAVLPDNVVLRGVIFNFPGSKNSIVVGDTFEFLIINSQLSFPKYNISAGDSILYTGINYNEIEIFVPKRSETTLGIAADGQLEGAIFTVVALGDINQTLQLDDQMEVVLADPTSSNPPYTVNMYRGEGEARTLVATFTIDKQQ
ncbi:MAG: carboxypeptidase regulatory-like domain-containing protein [Anaerolineales bacterium]|nr:carboxypeptidase regulatory-like domain-containing protein [Anaerolineales bacterium]